VKEPIEKLRKVLKEKKINYTIVDKFDPNIEHDVVFVIGEDRDVLATVQEMKTNVKPILGISITGATGFLTEVDIENIKATIHKFDKGDYTIEKLRRIRVSCSKCTAYALNEVAIFPSKSATLMEYALYVDDELIWRDFSDGIIVSTPLGSTAYSMSAGGPIISPKAKVFSIVSVNSMDPTRRPLIVSDNSIISIRDIVSKHAPEVIIDGIKRYKVLDAIKITKSRSPALLIRFKKDKQELHEKIKKKMEFARELMNLPPSAKFILKILEYEGPQSQKNLIKKTMLPPRTVRHALKILIDKGIIREKIALTRDARQKIYSIIR